MDLGSPHIYLRDGRRVGKPDVLLYAALDQAKAVESRGLTPVLTLNHLAVRTGVSYSYLRRIVSRTADPYNDLILKRRNGKKMRALSIPKPPLMEVQRWILDKIANRIPVHSDSYAYQTGSSIKVCASQHVGARWLIKLDVENFFESIDERRIFRVFRDAEYVPLVALELARLCTRSAAHASHIETSRFIGDANSPVIRDYSHSVLGYLPQGAPTSGALANLVAHDLDVAFSTLARQERMIYTRYADDLTFSSVDSFDRGKACRIVDEVRVCLLKSNFSLHEKKTRVIPPGGRKIVLGLLVDGEKIRLNKKIRGRITQNIRGVEVFGLSAHVLHRNFASIDGFVRHLSGLISFALDIEPSWAGVMQRRWQNALRTNGWSDDGV